MASFFDTEQAISLKKVQDTQQHLGINFPEKYIAHVLQYNGGRCEPNGFSFIERGKTADSNIEYFLAIYDGDYDNFVEYFHDYKTTEKRLPLSVFPIAHDPGGNLICLDSHDGKVYFWDHEKEVDYNLESDLNYSNLYLIADDFEEFLNNLRDL